MLFSKACIYGIRASFLLASRDHDEYLSINRISDKLELSGHFLTKILQELTQADILESMKGPKGGVRLKKSPSEIYIIDLVEAIDGLDLLTECVLGLPGCGNEKPCPLHEQWAEARTELEKFLRTHTLADISEKGKALNLRLTQNDDFNWGTLVD